MSQNEWFDRQPLECRIAWYKDALEDVAISANAVPAALRGGPVTPELAEVAAQVIEQLIARCSKQDRDMESLIRSFAPRGGRAGGS